MLKRLGPLVLSITLMCMCSVAGAQSPTWTIDLLGKEKKPEKFENRKLGSEKSADKKFTVVRHFFQNTYTHYNYYYTSNNKINEVIERAKAAQKDDYTKLLSYYPYSLENTVSQKNDLDSVILKTTAGILLHDLRNDWIDNMYLLMGEAFFLRKDFDSAAATFQFINYNLFPRKKDEDDNRIVGTGMDASNSTFSIATKEKQNVLQKVASQPPSRNDALLWMVRTLIEQGELGEAAGLISTLQNDPNLPPRLKNDLDYTYAYWFFKQDIYDSAANYLAKGLSSADTKQDMSRSEFLLAQLYEMTHKYDLASEFYVKSSKHTVDPLMDIYATLNNAKMRKGTTPEELDKSIAELIKMSKKDKFEGYRDIIFYAAADLALQKPDTTGAIDLYTKSLKYNENNISFKNKAFLQLADLAYDRHQYKIAFAFYDSLQSGDTTLNDRIADIQARRNSLVKIVEKIIIIEREDSLQAIAVMPVAERDAYIKKLLKRLRKEQGLKEEDNSFGDGSNAPIQFAGKETEPVDLFAANDAKSGDWYFYNSAVKTKGFAEFKRKWGTRKYSDNWRRKAAISSLPTPEPVTSIGMDNNSTDDIDKPSAANIANQGKTPGPAAPAPTELSFDGLMSNVPTTEEKLLISKNLVAVSMFQLAQLYQTELEDYHEAINEYNLSLQRFPDSLYDGELYLGLYYCYTKLGMNDKAAYYKNLVSKNFSKTNAALKINNPAGLDPLAQNPVVTERYANIYNLFIEGNFEQAFAEKKKADSIYGNTYWSPQLLYIEAVYHIKQRDDSVAIGVLQNIVSLYPNAKITPRTVRLIDVLKRRAEIEDYLTKLQVTRAADDEIVYVDERTKLVRNDSNLIKSPPPPRIDTTSKIKQPTLNLPKDGLQAPQPIGDTMAKVALPPTRQLKTDSAKSATFFINSPFSMDTEKPQNVLMVLDKVDPTYVNEAKNAFTRYLGENFRNDQIQLSRDTLNKDKVVLIFAPFANADAAFAFMQKLKKAAPDEVFWLPANKYSFLLISDQNFQQLKTKQDMDGYNNLLKKAMPGKF